MSWTYDPNFPEMSNDVVKDPSTPGRFTFERKMYFKPDSYDAWSTKKNYTNTNYSAQLATHPSIPALKSVCPDLPSFYLVDIVDISNLNADEDGEAVSYGVVTLLYENKKPKPQGTTNSDATENKPWAREVDDFTITNQEISVPFTRGYIDDKIVDVETTAGQPIYDFTTSIWIQRCTWTFCNKGTDYFISSPVINSADVTLFGKIKIKAGTGLLLPPSYRKLYYIDESGTESSYDEWQFEVIVNPNGQAIEVFNAGTVAKDSNGVPYDICVWYITDPVAQTYERKMGTFTQMMADKALVDTANMSIDDPTKQKTWTGDFAQSPLPIGPGGVLVTDGTKYVRLYEQYKRGSWNLGIR